MTRLNGMHVTRGVALALALASASTISWAQQPARAATAVAIRHATVIDVASGRLTSGQTIVIEGARIRAVTPDARANVPSGARVVDASGRFVIPGLWDMHVHAVGPMIDRLFLPPLAAMGVTGVRDMWGRFAWYDSARAQGARGELVTPRLVGPGHILDGAPAIWPGSTGVKDAAEARRMVDSLAAGGAAFIKVYSRLSPDEFRAAAAQATARGLPFAGHVPSLVSVGEASDRGMKSIEHLQMIVNACSRDEEAMRADYAAAQASPKGWDSAGVVARVQSRRIVDTFDEARCRALAERLRKNGTWMVPTMTVLRSIAYLDDSTLAADPRMAYVPRFFTAGWNPKNDFRFRMMTAQDWAVRKEVFAEQQKIVTLLHKAGVQFLAGTDLSNPYIFPGFSLHEELRNLVAAGFTPREALQAATLNPARYLNATDSLGTVQAGKLADLVVLDANPLENIANTERIHAVVLNGLLVDSAQRTKLLDDAKARTPVSPRPSLGQAFPPSSSSSDSRASSFSARTLPPPAPTPLPRTPAPWTASPTGRSAGSPAAPAARRRTFRGASSLTP
ncbi:MAG: amidohydrolase family protein [Gemmatimonadaceae bacterium]|nr:amidohydrolase family protein [Gemmatimonadaceae bacterium]